VNHELEAEVTIEAFNRFQVDYVVIGAFAAIAQAVPIPPTMDIDFYASPDRINLDRLANALDYLDAKIRVNDHGHQCAEPDAGRRGTRRSRRTERDDCRHVLGTRQRR